MRKSRKSKRKRKAFKRLVLFLVGAYGLNVVHHQMMRLGNVETETRSSSQPPSVNSQGHFHHPPKEKRPLEEVEDAPPPIAISHAGAKVLISPQSQNTHALRIDFRNNQRIADTISEDIVVCEMAKRNFTKASGLHSIVTGLEHAGTTIMGEMIMSAPNLFGGFECGVLLSSNPSDFASIDPFYEWMGKPDHFGLTGELRDELLLSSGCHAEMYQRLMQHSTFFQKSPHKQLQSSWLVDKTPRYVRFLDHIMDRAPGVPVVVIQKDEADQIRSFMKYATRLVDLEKRKNFATNLIEKATAGINRATAKYGSSGRLLIVNATELYESPNSVMKKVFEFLGLQWRPEYLSMKALNEKRLLAGYDKNATAFDPKALYNVNKTKKED